MDVSMCVPERQSNLAVHWLGPHQPASRAAPGWVSVSTNSNFLSLFPCLLTIYRNWKHVFLLSLDRAWICSSTSAAAWCPCASRSGDLPESSSVLKLLKR